MKVFIGIVAGSILTVLTCVFADHAIAQTNSVTVTGSAQIVAPIALSHPSGNTLSFGNVLPPSFSDNAGGPGDVTVSGSSATYEFPDMVPATPGTITSAAFHVAGTSGLSFDISTPSVSSYSSGWGTMTLSLTAASTPATLTGSGYDFLIGGVIHVPVGQTAQAYSAVIDESVNYN